MKKTVTCLHCGKNFEKDITQIKRSPNNYCSKTCSAIDTNKKYTKRKRTTKCKSCDTLILSSRTYCDKCLKDRRDNFISDDEKTIGEVVYSQHHKSSAFSLIRYRARAKCKKFGWCECCICGYSHHIEIAHIKAISEFSDDCKISEVNDLHNLLPMCPNHHWELDNGIISLSDIDNEKLEELQNRGIGP
jgi:predicted restriction endonuclease